MATKHADEQTALLCAKCMKLVNDPRIGHCGHSYCESCLESILKELPQGTGEGDGTGEHEGGILFRCPQPDCENPQYHIPSPSIEHFPVNLNLKQKVEEMKIREAETICHLHGKPCELFCKESHCMREICRKCLKDHQKHAVIDKDDACSEYIAKCRDVSEQVSAKLKGIEGSKKELNTLIDGEENKLAACFDKLFEVFTAAETTLANEQIECITKSLQELEFNSPSRTQMELESRAAPLRYIQRIGRPILEKPGKNLKEPVIVIQAAEFALTTLKQKEADEQFQLLMKASLADFAHLKHGFLTRLSENYRIGMICKYPS